MVDVGRLEATVADLRCAAGDVAPHTLRSYERRWRMWEAFADHYGICAMPADGRHVAAFVVARHAAGVSPSGIAANLSAVSWFHRRFDDRLDPVGDARAVLRVLSKREPAPPIEPAPVLSVGVQPASRISWAVAPSALAASMPVSERRTSHLGVGCRPR